MLPSAARVSAARVSAARLSAARLSAALLLASLLFASRGHAQDQATESGGPTETSVALLLGLGLRPTTDGTVRGFAYGVDIQFLRRRMVTLNAGCDQFISDQGLTFTRVRVWSTACGVAAGLGYRAPKFFIGTSAGADLVLSAQSVRFVDAADRAWAMYGLARLQAHAHYVYGRARLGATVRVRLGRFGRRDTRLLLSVGWAL